MLSVVMKTPGDKGTDYCPFWHISSIFCDIRWQVGITTEGMDKHPMSLQLVVSRKSATWTEQDSWKYAWAIKNCVLCLWTMYTNTYIFAGLCRGIVTWIQDTIWNQSANKQIHVHQQINHKHSLQNYCKQTDLNRSCSTKNDL